MALKQLYPTIKKLITILKAVYHRIKKSIKALLYYTIGFDFLLIFIFSRTPVYLLWWVIVALGLFGGREADMVNIFCIFLVVYIIGTANIIWLVCISQRTRKMVENLVGPTFLKRFAPNPICL